MRVKTYDLSNRIIFVHSQSRDTIPLSDQAIVLTALALLNSLKGPAYAGTNAKCCII